MVSISNLKERLHYRNHFFVVKTSKKRRCIKEFEYIANKNNKKPIKEQQKCGLIPSLCVILISS